MTRSNNKATISVPVEQAFLWLQAYHRETLDIALKISSAGSSMARLAFDISRVPDADKMLLGDEYSRVAQEFERLNKLLSARNEYEKSLQ